MVDSDYLYFPSFVTGKMEYFKRKNSFGIAYFPNEKADIDDVCEVLGKLDISVEDVYGVQQVGLKKIIVKLEDSAGDRFERVIRDYEGRVFSLERRNVSIQIVNLSSTKTVVTVKNVPFEVSNDTLTRILSEYGEVYNIRSQFYTEGILNGKNNGNRTALMKISKPIPSSIVFKRFSLFVFYRGQVRTCHKCGLAGHMAVDCPSLYRKIVNRFSEEDFPDLDGSNNSRDNSNVTPKQNNESHVTATDIIEVISEEIEANEESSSEDPNKKLDTSNSDLMTKEINDMCLIPPPVKTQDLILLGNEDDGLLKIETVNVDVHCLQGSYLDSGEKTSGIDDTGAQCSREEGEEEEEEETTESISPCMECEEEISPKGDESIESDKDSDNQWEVVGKNKKRKVIKKYNMRKNSRNGLKLNVLSSKRKNNMVIKEAVKFGKLRGSVVESRELHNDVA